MTCTTAHCYPFQLQIIKMSDGGAGSAQEDDSDFFGYYGGLSPDPPTKRDLCDRCRRPVTVCWCQYLPAQPICVGTTIYILQHPFEESRTLKTAPMLFHGLQPGKCHIWRGKRFNTHKNTALRQLATDPNTLLLYPGPNAVCLADFVLAETGRGHHGPYNLILLDGTWMQARGLYTQNHFLHKLKQVRLEDTGCSEYVIRTQPTEGALSTVESAAVTIATLENRPEIRQLLTQPLRALCDYQIQHGAVKHHSKEYLMDRGLLHKQQPHSHAAKDHGGKSSRIQGNDVAYSENALGDAPLCDTVDLPKESPQTTKVIQSLPSCSCSPINEQSSDAQQGCSHNECGPYCQPQSPCGICQASGCHIASTDNRFAPLKGACSVSIPEQTPNSASAS